ncbi:AAA family ATPase [Salmonella enterica]|nr:ATP-binding protein [Salmonella enterica subsp. houtenae]EJF5608071.1 AAA family ATPase [Salmonella enterica]EJF5984165.1 AAA family ATPase [Salmonella enterica]EJJ4020061.1 AAA family ATPase [Salmonella enterica]EJJ4098725.1 AAA family ATPase [Salmonella enterica]
MNRYLTPGCKTVILINGIPASGKSTVTRQLSTTFNLPLLTIDGIKEPFMARFTDIDRPFNRQLGCAAYEVIWSIVGQSSAGFVWLIDAWFGFQPREMLQQLLQQAGVEKVLEVWNQVSPELAVSRYASRLQARKPGHPGEEYLPELAQLAQRAQPMRLGPVFTVDQQQQPLDIASVIRWIEAQIQ